MGSLLNRSSAHKDETNVKVKKDKRKRLRRRSHEHSDIPFEQDEYLKSANNENNDPKIDSMETLELWNNKYDQTPIININVDPPGAPRTYSPNFSISQHDMMIRQWSSSSRDMNNSFYPINVLQPTPASNIPYDPNQHIHSQMPSSITTRSPKVLTEERVPKKVQFSTAGPQQQQQQQPATSLKPLTSMHSWHEFKSTPMDTSMPSATKPMRSSTRSSTSRPASLIRKPPSTKVPVQKPIYIGIDHQATLAERGQTIATKHTRKTDERNHVNEFNSSTDNQHQQQQSRSHTNHQHKRAKPTDSPLSDNPIIPSISFDSLHPTLSSRQRIMKKSMSTTKMPQMNERMPFAANDIRSSTSRNNHRQLSSIQNEIKPLKTRDNQRPRVPSGSPLLIRTEASNRRIENTHSNSPVRRGFVSTVNQQQHRQTFLLSGVTSTATTTAFSRTRI